MSARRERGFHWARLRERDGSEARAWTIVLLPTEADWVEAIGADQVFSEDDVAEWGPRVFPPGASPHPVDALKDICAQLGQQVDPQVESEMRAICDEPCDVVPTAELQALRETATAARLLWKLDFATAFPRLVAALEALYGYPTERPPPDP